jgi:hypothetical protein
MSEALLIRINRAQRGAFWVGVIALASCAVGVWLNSRQFFISYLFAYLFWLGLSLGCLCVAMIHHLTGGRWGDVSRRFLEAGYLTIPAMSVLFLPLLAGLHVLYPWANPGELVQSDIARHRAHYMNIPAFVGRAVIYFAIWIALGGLLRKWSRQQDLTESLAPTRQARALSGPGVILYALTVTFASVDWLMSLETDWFSTVFPVIICGGQILTAFALSVVLLTWFREFPPMLQVVEAGQFHQLGNLLLTFVMFWTYVSFGQLLIIWSGDLPHEIGWYLHRIAGHWEWVIGFIALFNFFLPFFLLLFRASKRKPQALSVLSGVIIFSQIVNWWWVVEPSFFQSDAHIHWMDFAATIGIGGLWMAVFAAYLKSAPLLTKNDPRISYSFAHA